MCGRTCPTVSAALPRRPNCSRRTTRTRSAAALGAPDIRRSAVVGLDVVHDDLLVAELGARHQLLERGEQRPRRCAS